MAKDVGEETGFDYFASLVHWSISSSLTTIHLLTTMAVANTIMSLRGFSFDPSKKRWVSRLHFFDFCYHCVYAPLLEEWVNNFESKIDRNRRVRGGLGRRADTFKCWETVFVI